MLSFVQSLLVLMFVAVLVYLAFVPRPFKQFLLRTCRQEIYTLHEHIASDQFTLENNLVTLLHGAKSMHDN